jgi:hypothetical protein
MQYTPGVLNPNVSLTGGRWLNIFLGGRATLPETSPYKIQTPGNYPEENIQHTEHGESLKSRMPICCLYWPTYTESPAVCQFQWPRGLRSGSAAERLLGLWVRIQSRAWVSCLFWAFCAVRLRSLFRADHSSWGVLPSVACTSGDRKASIMRRSWPTGGFCPIQKKIMQFTSMDSPFDQKTHIEAKTSLYKISTDAYLSPKGSIQTTRNSLVAATSNRTFKRLSRNCTTDFIGVNILPL